MAGATTRDDVIAVRSGRPRRASTDRGRSAPRGRPSGGRRPPSSGTLRGKRPRRSPRPERCPRRTGCGRPRAACRPRAERAVPVPRVLCNGRWRAGGGSHPLTESAGPNGDVSGAGGAARCATISCVPVGAGPIDRDLRGPVCSTHRATHSLSVEASRRMRARGRSPRTAANRSGVVRIRRSITSPPSLRMQSWLSFLCTSIPIWSMAGPPLHCGVDRVFTLWGSVCHTSSGVSHFIQSTFSGDRRSGIAGSNGRPRSERASGRPWPKLAMR
jgi:hypothetical protein